MKFGDFLSGLGTSAAIGAVDSGIGLLTNKIQSRQNIKNAKNMALFNDNLQRKMILDSASLQKQGLQDAGISVASLNGGFNSVSNAASANADMPSAPDFDAAGALSSLVGLKVSKADVQSKEADAKLKDEQARAQKLANDKVEALQNAWREKGKNNHFVYKGEKFDDPDKLFAKYPDANFEDVETVATPGTLSAEEYSIDSKRNRIKSEEMQFAFEYEVNKAKFLSDDIKYAAANMSLQEFENLKKTGDILAKDDKIKGIAYKIANEDLSIRKQQYLLNQLAYEIQDYEFKTSKNVDFRKVYSEMLDKTDLSFKDYIKLLASFIVSQLSSGFSFGFGKSGKHFGFGK